MADEKENLMDRLNNQFMPRETLNVTFNQLWKQWEKLEVKLDNMPKELMKDFNEKYGSQFEAFEESLEDLEKKVNNLEKVYWKFLGGMLTVGAMGALLEWGAKMFSH